MKAISKSITNIINPNQNEKQHIPEGILKDLENLKYENLKLKRENSILNQKLNELNKNEFKLKTINKCLMNKLDK
jgi:hypothetical protein